MQYAQTYSKCSTVDHYEERYRAGMILGGVGDALGYKNGDWEFCDDGRKIHRELTRIGGVKKINVKYWIVSDDTVMHLATADALIANGNCDDLINLYYLLAESYKQCMNDMKGRNPGNTCIEMCRKLNTLKAGGYCIPFNPRAGGCGAAMRSMCIGLRYPRQNNIARLIEVSIESGRMTHHHPTGYLGSLASALFASYAIQGKPLKEWGAGLMETLKHAKRYIISCKDVYVKENIEAWGYFETKWEQYLRLRNIGNGMEDPRFPPDFNDVVKRDQFYSMISYTKCGGSSGHDAPMIAYDALLASNGNWEELCNRAMFHGGDSDSTGSIAGCLFGILYGIDGVPDSNYKELEYRDRLQHAGSKLFKLAISDLQELVSGKSEFATTSRKSTAV